MSQNSSCGRLEKWHERSSSNFGSMKRLQKSKDVLLGSQEMLTVGNPRSPVANIQKIGRATGGVH